FVNPGGPGAPGRDSATFATPELRERFDIVGFDPRGVGASSPAVRCAATSEEAAALLNPTFPTGVLQELTALTKAAQGAAGCRRSATIASHMSTGNVARDLELLRKAVSDPKLNFLGFSSGSLIGQTYANLFPSTTRALALDGALDPVRFTTGRGLAEGSQPLDYRLKSYVGTDEAVSGFLAACADAPGTCAFAPPGATAASLRTKFNATLARIRSGNGVTVDFGDGEETLSYQDVVGLIYGELNAGIFTSQDLAGTLEAIDLASLGQSAAIPSDDLQAFFDALQRWTTGGGGPVQEPYDNFQDAFSTFVCNDTRGPSLSTTYALFGRIADAQVAGFGPFWIYTTASCASFPVRDDDAYLGPWGASTQTPVLLLGNRGGDPSVRYANAVAAQGTLGNAALLSVDMYGHTAYNLASTCVNEAVDAYFISLQVPAPGASCGTDFGPFDPIEELVEAEGAESGYARGRAPLS
ncbi:MAG: alpha/beta fold hydrolase, partial [Solirubrobacteraceae bacterium]|nr:alpha/beta fold hydrolase [Solirubrobacteraceae bacterium]